MTQVSAVAQPNIALIKYWGKRDTATNLPAVDSLSLTLKSLYTRMTVDFAGESESDALIVNGEKAPRLLSRVSACLDNVCGKERSRATVVSEGNFPIGAGLASSASAFAALVVAANGATGMQRDALALARLAGQASGSAARSLFGGIVSLNVRNDEIDVKQIVDAEKWPLEVIVAVTAKGEKAVGSGDAMLRSAKTSPFYQGWVDRQSEDFDTAAMAVQDRDFNKLASIAEHNCLKMHSVMWTSKPPIVYWNEATLSCMEAVRKLQKSGHPAFFTIDAGPQVKVVCLPEVADVVREAMREVDGVVDIMQSSLGSGARLLNTE